MKWEKLGKIFDPTNFDLPNRCKEFAQSPQALVVGDVVRVYFSTRERDSSGKYLSHVAFVDFDKAFHVKRVSTKPVIKLGDLGCFDEHGIFPLNVLKVESEILGYIGGWSRRISVSVDGSIGLARSRNDGKTFERVGKGPVLSSSLNEPFLIGDPFVLRDGAVFHMWYIFGTRWKRFAADAQPDRTYKIGHAVSKDGYEWQKPSEGQPIIADKLGEDESQALPTVIKIGDFHHMLFCYRQSSDFRANSNRAYRIGHAYSRDLLNWIRDDASFGIDVTPGSWDSDMLCYPHLLEVDDVVYLMYNGNEFGRYGFGLARLIK